MDIVRASYPYACASTGPGGGASKGQLVFPEGAVLLVAERSDDGWCRGYSAGNQGWFPASYVSPITPEQLLMVNHLSVECSLSLVITVVFVLPA